MQRDTVPRTLPHHRPAAYWLVVKCNSGRVDVLTVDLKGRGEALAVFGFEEEARLFSLSSSAEGWRPRETTAGELAGLLLSDPYADVEFVTLDHTQGAIFRGQVKLVGLRRGRSVARPTLVL